MALKRSKHINIFDVLALALAIGVVLIAASAYLYKPKTSGNSVFLTVKTLTPDAAVIEKAARNQDEVYLNSVNTPVKVTEVERIGQNLLITVKAPGEISHNKYIFNGQRVLIGQKAEIHGNYFAQGQITEVKNEN
jgi:hypothetical protein